MGALAACTSSGEEQGPSGNTQINLISNPGNIEFEFQSAQYRLECDGAGTTQADTPDGTEPDDDIIVEGNFDVTGDEVPTDNAGPADVYEAITDVPLGECDLFMWVMDEDEIRCSGQTTVTINPGLNLFDFEIFCDVSFQTGVGQGDIQARFRDVIGNFCPLTNFVNSVNRMPDPGEFDIPVEIRAYDEGNTCGDACDCRGQPDPVACAIADPPSFVIDSLTSVCCALPAGVFNPFTPITPQNAPLNAAYNHLLVLKNCAGAPVPDIPLPGGGTFPIPSVDPVGGWNDTGVAITTAGAENIPDGCVEGTNCDGQIQSPLGDQIFNCDQGSNPAAGDTVPCCAFTDGDTECLKTLCDVFPGGLPVRPTTCPGDNRCDGTEPCTIDDDCANGEAGEIGTCVADGASPEVGFCAPIQCDFAGDCQDGGTCSPSTGICPAPTPLPDDTLCDLNGSNDGFCLAGDCVACTQATCDVEHASADQDCNTISCDAAVGCAVANNTSASCGTDITTPPDGIGEGTCLAPDATCTLDSDCAGPFGNDGGACISGTCEYSVCQDVVLTLAAATETTTWEANANAGCNPSTGEDCGCYVFSPTINGFIPVTVALTAFVDTATSNAVDVDYDVLAQAAALGALGNASLFGDPGTPVPLQIATSVDEGLVTNGAGSSGTACKLPAESLGAACVLDSDCDTSPGNGQCVNTINSFPEPDAVGLLIGSFLQPIGDFCVGGGNDGLLCGDPVNCPDGVCQNTPEGTLIFTSLDNNDYRCKGGAPPIALPADEGCTPSGGNCAAGSCALPCDPLGTASTSCNPANGDDDCIEPTWNPTGECVNSKAAIQAQVIVTPKTFPTVAFNWSGQFQLDLVLTATGTPITITQDDCVFDVPGADMNVGVTAN